MEDHDRFRKDITRREAMQTALKGAAYAAPVILAVTVPLPVAAQVSRPPNARVTASPNPSPRTGTITLNGTGFASNSSVVIQFASRTSNTDTAVTPTQVDVSGAFTVRERLSQDNFGTDTSLTINILDSSRRTVFATTTVELTGPRT